MNNKKKKLLFVLFVVTLGLVPGLFISGNNLISKTMEGLPDISWQEEIVINDIEFPKSVLDVPDEEITDEIIEDVVIVEEVIDEEDEENIILLAIEESVEDIEEILTTPIKDIPNKFYQTAEENKGLITILSAITTGVIIVVVIASKTIVFV